MSTARRIALHEERRLLGSLALTPSVFNLRRDMLEAEWDSIGFQRFGSALDAQVIEETLYACFAVRHENKPRVYGAILADTDIAPVLSRYSDLYLPLPLHEARVLADGDHSFVVRVGTNVELRTFCYSCASEYELFRIRDEFLRGISIYEDSDRQIAIVTRSIDGEVRVLGPRSIAIKRDDNWYLKQYKYAYAEGVRLSQPLESKSVRTIREALSLCVHGLSAQRVGGTIVIKRTEGAFQSIGSIGSTRAPQPEISISDPRWHIMLVRLMAQTDGAILVRSDGQLELVGAKLATTPTKCSPHPGGMRHNSAKSYSACYPDCTLIVVSESGPVTVFASGAAVPPWDPLCVRTDMGQVRCQSCQLLFEIEPTDGNGDQSCPRCGQSLQDGEVGAGCRLRVKA